MWCLKQSHASDHYGINVWTSVGAPQRRRATPASLQAFVNLWRSRASEHTDDFPFQGLLSEVIHRQVIFGIPEQSVDRKKYIGERRHGQKNEKRTCRQYNGVQRCRAFGAQSHQAGRGKEEKKGREEAAIIQPLALVGKSWVWPGWAWQTKFRNIDLARRLLYGFG